jgi:N-acyl-D-amino-acid deacylase
LAPGFIDTHSHAADGLSTEELSAARPQLAQGITTVVVNPDGGGSVDLIRQQEQLTEHDLGINVAQMIPHGSIRREVLLSSSIRRRSEIPPLLPILINFRKD